MTPIDSETISYLPDGVISWNAKGVITEVAPFSGQSVTEALAYGVVTPGLVDAHLHYPQLRVLGAAGQPLLQWLAQSVYPEEARFADDGYAREVASEFCTALASAGTTSAMIYGSVHPRAIHWLFKEMDRRNMRGIAGPVLMNSDVPRELTLDVVPAMAGLCDLVNRWHQWDGRLEVAVIPRFALSCTREMLAAAAEFAHKHELRVGTHLSENRDECHQVRHHFGTADYLTVYEQTGLLSDRSLFAHCVHLSDSEWDRLGSARAGVVHCPDSNAYLGSGRLPLGQVISREIPFAVGSDVAAGRSFSMAQHLAQAHENSVATNCPVSPERLFWWGTRGGAKTLGLDGVGAIKKGLEADLVWWGLPDSLGADAQSVVGTLVSGLARPRRTWVRGKIVWEESDKKG
ncbi:MAG: guanine deaminase [Proteobacteria bacterium]|nr:guanine deaminase [Pseudomonadota bacterium]